MLKTYRGTYRIWGPPGTGKTAFLTNQVKRILEQEPEARILICSLTKTAAREIASRNERLPDWRVGTLHSHAYRSLEAPPITETLLKDWNEANPTLQMQLRSVDTDDFMSTDQSTRGEGDKLYQDYCVIRARMLPRELWSNRIMGFAQQWEDFKKETGTIDFTDMIEFALQDVEEAPYQSEILIADEAQDLSRLEMKLLAKWGQKAGALMIAGDSYQAIFCWRGADPSIFTSKLSKDFPEPTVGEDRERVLSQSYRLPKAVYSFAIDWAKNLSDYRELPFKPRDFEGSVSSADATWREPESMIKEIKHLYRTTDKKIMILGSCSYFLARIISQLRGEGLPFSNPWRVQRGDWNPLQFGRKLSPRVRILNFLRVDIETWGEYSRLWSWDEARTWADMLRSKDCMVNGAKAALKRACESESAADRADPDLFLLEDSVAALAECSGTEAYLDWFESRLLAAKHKSMAYPMQVAREWGAGVLKENERIYVGTIHSFKGAEADVCYVIPDLSQAALEEWTGNPSMKDNVVRLFYVALTRARESVRLLQPSNPEMSVTF